MCALFVALPSLALGYQQVHGVVTWHLRKRNHESNADNILTSCAVCSCIAAVRQAIAKAIVAFYQKYVDEASKREIKETLV